METTQVQAKDSTAELLKVLIAQVEDLQDQLNKPAPNLGWGKKALETVHCSRKHTRWYTWEGDGKTGSAKHIAHDEILCKLQGIHLFETTYTDSKGQVKTYQKADVHVSGPHPMAFRVSAYAAVGKCLLSPLLKLTHEQRLKPINIRANHNTESELVLLMDVSLDEEPIPCEKTLPEWPELQAKVNQLNAEMGFTPPERKEKKEKETSNKQRLVDAMDRLKVAKADRAKTAKKYLPSGKASDQCSPEEIDNAIAQMKTELEEPDF